jgi:3-oxoacyl-[acyl-carrier protein] reductase
MILSGKNAFVTGTNRGIGAAILDVFAANGANVFAHARRETDEFLSNAREIADRRGVEIWPVFFDLTDHGAMKLAIKEIMSSKRQIDILVNNAGIAPDSASFLMTPVEKIKDVFEVNFFAQIALTQYITRLMTRGKSGSIVNVASVAGLDGGPAQLEYAASKAAIIGAAKHLAIELADFNIRVNSVAPGPAETAMTDKMEETLMARTLARTTMGRMARTEEIANVVLFLASDLSSYMTGQTIRVDGGMLGG